MCRHTKFPALFRGRGFTSRRHFCSGRFFAYFLGVCWQWHSSLILILPASLLPGQLGFMVGVFVTERATREKHGLPDGEVRPKSYTKSSTVDKDWSTSSYWCSTNGNLPLPMTEPCIFTIAITLHRTNQFSPSFQWR